MSGTPARLGRYEILAPIGRGGMAEVFLARIVGPGGIEKRVCVKRLLPAIVADPRASQQFSSEARTALALQHANIVPVFDFGREGQELYLVMEWIDGCDLGRLLSHFGRPLPPLRAAYVAGEIARALAYAHDRGDNEASGPLVHRDVTPRNVLLSRRGEVRLTDFGIARVGGAAGALAGTPRYMSSEQACGERARPADDVYALGLVLAEMLTGRPVRSTNSLEEAKAPVDPPEIPTAGPELQQIVGAMLAPDPAARLARAAEVQAALGRVLADAVLRGEGAPAEALSQDVAAAAVPAPDRFGAPAAPETIAAPTVVGTESGSDPPRPPRRWIGVLVVSLAVAVGLGTVVAASRGRRMSPDRAVVARDVPPTSGAAPKQSPPVPLAVSSPTAATTPATAPAARSRRAANAELKVLAPGSWISVYLDGRKLSDDAGRFTISPGRHRLRVENQPLGFSRSETIEARPGETIERTYRPGAAE